MQLISILLVTVSVLTVLSGIAALAGSKKDEQVKSAWFFVTTVSAAIWSISIVLFLSAAPDTSMDTIIWYVRGIYIPPLIMDIALLGYISWKRRGGNIAFMILASVVLVLICVFLSRPELLYENIELSRSGNFVHLRTNWFYISYVAFFMVNTFVFLFFLFCQIRSPQFKRIRSGLIAFFIGLSIAGGAALFFDLLLPLERYDLIWIGPLTIGVTMVSFYYAILKYHMINLSAWWLKALSYIILIASAVVVYMVIFFLVFVSLFRIPNPSSSVIFLNFVMIAIVLLLFPVLGEMAAFIRSLISTQHIDISYVVKKITKLNPKTVDYKNLAAFLAEHMHFEYIGFLIDGQLYGSKQYPINEDSIKMIGGLGDPENGVWQKVDERNLDWQRAKLSAVAALRNNKNKTYGQMLIGDPMGKIEFEKRDLVQVELIISLVASTLSTKGKK